MIPLRYEKVEYTDVPENVKSKFDVIRETRKGLYIHGPVGTGKTHIAYSIKKHWDEVSRYGALFWNTTELLTEIREDFDRPNIEKSRVEERLMDFKGLLIFDDIGSEKPTEWVLEKFYLVVNKRYNDMRPIIFTSNLSIPQLAERLGDRIASRLVEMCDIIKLEGEDRRLQ